MMIVTIYLINFAFEFIPDAHRAGIVASHSLIPITM